MKNAEWLIEKGYQFSDVIIKYSDTDNRRKFIILVKHEKVDEFSLDGGPTSLYAFERWLGMERNVLNDAERHYLTGVIKPFRNEIHKIEKSRNWPKSLDRICFYMKNYEDVWYLPAFKAETMYKGMEPDKEYTVEELGL